MPTMRFISNVERTEYKWKDLIQNGPVTNIILYIRYYRNSAEINPSEA
jgi:hypothetical protein